MADLVPYRKLSVGYDLQHGIRFIDVLKPYSRVIREVYFAWPGVANGRAQIRTDSPVVREKLKNDLLTILRWCRTQGIELNLLLNANCYGNDAFSESLRSTVTQTIDTLSDNGLYPEIVTTASPFIAKVLKMQHPDIDVRASVNMQLNSTLAMEFVSDLFDSFYICQDIQRDLQTVQLFSDSCHSRKKKLCMLLNSGCLINCPVRTWHNNFICHENTNYHSMTFQMHFPLRLCDRHFQSRENLVDFLRMSWIRPEDVWHYEPYLDVLKLATRDIMDYEPIIRAYAEGHYEGSVFDYIGYHNEFCEFENSAFPEDWFESGIAQKCAANCTHCGKCEQVLRQVIRNKKVTTESTYSFATV